MSATEDLDFGVTVRGMSPGQRLFADRYVLSRLLGRGGMGVVWLAHDGKLEREVALKFLPDMVRMEDAAIDELKRETRRSLELTHPHIVRIHDFVDDARTAAIVMEYVDGATTSALRVARPSRVFEPGELADWVRQLVEALEYAHQRVRIVHRDLKPANLMVNRAGQLKITDFGIARSISDSVSRVSVQPTATGGTLLYMSPQQAAGGAVTVGDDIYALGATLYELLTSKPPFFTGNIFHQIENVAPQRLADRRRELGLATGGASSIPEAWEETLRACLAKDPAGRPASVGEVAERLGLRPSFHRPAPMPTPPPLLAAAPEWRHVPPPDGRPVLSTPLLAVLVAFGVVLLAGIAAGGFYLASTLHVWQENDRPTTRAASSTDSNPPPPAAAPAASEPPSPARRQQEQSEAQQSIESLLANADRLEEARARLRRYLESYGADAFYNATYTRIDRLAADQQTRDRRQEQARAQQNLETLAADHAHLDELRAALRSYLEVHGRDAFYDSIYARFDRLAQEQAPPPPQTGGQEPAAAAASSNISAQDVGNLIINNLNALQRQDLRTFVAAYADRVSWFDDGNVSRDYIYRDKIKYFETWSTLRMSMTQQIRVYDTERPDIKRAEFQYHFLAANARTGKVAQGDSFNTWTVQKFGNALLITATRERVTNRRTTR